MYTHTRAEEHAGSVSELYTGQAIVHWTGGEEKKAKKGRHNGERTAQGPTRNTCLQMKGPIFQGEASECEERIGYVFARTVEKGVGGNVV